MTSDSTQSSSPANHAPIVSDRKKIKAVLWDMDGTLLDTESLSDIAILEVLKMDPLEHNEIIPWQLKKPTLGLRGADWIPMVLKYAHETWKLPAKQIPTLGDFWIQWERRLGELSAQRVLSSPGILELVEAFERQQIPMAIATSSRLQAVQHKRKRYETTIFKKMQHIVTGDDPAVRNGKPAPDIYLEAARRMSVDPSECLVMEDALAGVQSGKAAGCKVCVCPDARYTQQERTDIFVQQGGADVVLQSWYDFDGTQFGLPEIRNLKKRITDQQL